MLSDEQLRDLHNLSYKKLEEAVKEYADSLCKLPSAFLSEDDHTNFYEHIRTKHKWPDTEIVGMILEHDASFVGEMHDAEHEAWEGMDEAEFCDANATYDAERHEHGR